MPRGHFALRDPPAAGSPLARHPGGLLLRGDPARACAVAAAWRADGRDRWSRPLHCHAPHAPGSDRRADGAARGALILGSRALAVRANDGPLLPCLAKSMNCIRAAILSHGYRPGIATGIAAE